jgi:hypothetical protein
MEVSQSSFYCLSVTQVNEDDSQKPLITFFLVIVPYHESDHKFLSYIVAV